MRAEFVYVRCPQCQEQFRTSAGVPTDRIELLMPVLKQVRARCPHCGARMSVGEARIECPAKPSIPVR